VNRWLLRCCFLLASCPQGFGIPAAIAQSPVSQSTPSAPPSESNRTPELLKLDLIALDRDGRPVTDLKPEELRLFEGKDERKIRALPPAAREPLAIGLFFDMSGSRHGDLHFHEEVRLATEFLHLIWQEGDTGFVVTFNDVSSTLVQPTTRLEEIILGLGELPEVPRRGSTALYDGLCSMKPEKLLAISSRKIYVAFGDFEDNAGLNSFERVGEVLREGRVSIFPVILPEEFVSTLKKEEKVGRQRAQRIADETGGEVLILESPEQLVPIFRRLAADLQSAYRITYDSSPANSQKRVREEKFGSRRLAITSRSYTQSHNSNHSS
jgi:VWFA-related protein